MNWVALRMLTGDRTKFLGIVFGVSFASLLMGQQMAIFCGLMRNTTSQIRDIEGADIWVMAESVQFVDDVKPMAESRLLQVRGVPGVEWAVRLFKGIGRARLADGNYQQVIVIGLDDATLVGAPGKDRILHGDLGDLRQPNAVFVDEFGWRFLYGEVPFEPGRTIEMNLFASGAIHPAGAQEPDVHPGESLAGGRDASGRGQEAGAEVPIRL
jgi:putative ABC transport system permease protein